VNHFTVPFSLTKYSFRPIAKIHLCGTLLNFPERKPPSKSSPD
jgi:hypothetical protein